MSFRGPKLLALAALATAALAQGRPERFDYAVRNDFFAGFSGNQEAFQRAMKTTEGVLAQNPKHAEALVWHGAEGRGSDREEREHTAVRRSVELRDGGDRIA